MTKGERLRGLSPDVHLFWNQRLSLEDREIMDAAKILKNQNIIQKITTNVTSGKIEVFVNGDKKTITFLEDLEPLMESSSDGRIDSTEESSSEEEN